MVFVISFPVAANNPPGIEIVEPAHGEIVSSTIVIWMVAWDLDGNDQIQEVWVRIDGGDLLNATYNHTDAEGQWWYYEWDTTTVEDGWHDITAIAWDGIDDASDTIEVQVDNIPENNPPGIEIVEPGHAEIVSGTIMIWMVAWDPDGNDQIQEVWVRIDGGDLLNATYNHTDAEGQWWYYEWDTTTVEDGWHDITAIAWDGIDDASDIEEVQVDNVPENNPPGIEIVEPAHAEVVSGTIMIWMVAWDPDGNDQIQEVWVRIDGGDLLNATYNHTDAEGQWWYYEWDTTTVEDGWHDITAIVWDGIDDASDVIEVQVDNVPENNPPGIEIVEPGHAEIVSGTIMIWMVAWDPDGNDQIQEVWVRIDGGDLLNATYNHTDAEGQWWYYEWDTTTVEDGWHDITAIAWDGIDDASDIEEVQVDNVPENNPPGIEIMEPAGGSTVNGTIVIWMVAWDLDGNDQIQDVWVRIDGGDWLNATYNHTDAEGQWWYYEWDTTEVEDGWHHISAIVFDGIAYDDDLIEIFVDNVPENNPPGIEIVEPAHGEIVSGTIIIWMVAWDPDGNDQIQEVWVRIDGGDLLNATYNHTDAEGQWWYYEWDTTTVEDGWHDITAIAWDGIDDASDTIEVQVDNIPENNPPGIEIVEPGHAEIVSGTIMIWMVAWDPDGNDQIQEVWVRIDGGDLLNATYNHTDAEGQWWYYEWDTTTVEDGWHDITAIAWDGIDDASDTIEVQVDNIPENNPPGIEIVEPAHGETVSGIIVIWMVAWDPDGNDQIQEVWVRIDGGDLLNATYNHTDAEGQWWYYEWDTTTVEDGWHDITAIAWDGIDDAHDVIEVIVDNVPENAMPRIEIVEPADGATVNGVVVIWMVAWDLDGNDQIQEVWVRIDNGDLLNATYTHTDAEGQWWYYEWDTTTVEDGWHDITAIAWDGIDDGHDVIEVLVDNVPENSPPGIEIVEPAGGSTVNGTVVIWMVAWDLDGNDQIQDVWVRIDGGDWLNATYNHTDTEGQWWYYEWDTTTVEDGWHHISAIVYDGINYVDDLIEIFIDNIPENNPPGIEIVEPEDGETISGVVVIWMVAWDPDGNDQIQDVWIRIDGGDLLNATYNHTDNEGQWWYYEWDTTTVEDGWHSIKATVFDGIDDGHDIIEVYVDNIQMNQSPEVWIVEPVNGATISGEEEIWIRAMDPNGNEEIESVLVKIDDGDWQQASFVELGEEYSWWVYKWDTATVMNGEHHIYAMALDGQDESEVGDIGVLVNNPDKEPEFYSLLLVLILAVLGILVVFCIAACTEVGKFALFSLIFLPLYTKLSKKDILDHFVRGQIYGYIKINPGDNYTTIKKNLELKNGTLTYHLNILEREGMIKSWTDGRHKYFYPQGAKIPGNGIKNPSIYDSILKSIKDSPGISIKDIAAVNGISRQLANYHVRKLASEGRIELDRKSLSKLCYPK